VTVVGGQRAPRAATSRRGFTITELLLVSALIGLMAMAGVPRAARAFELGRLDDASSVLHSIWRGQRLYWLETRAYADDLRDLEALGLVDDEVLLGKADFKFAVDAADADSFSVTATRQYSSEWTGTVSIDETGALSGSLSNGAGDVLTPIAN